MPTGFRPFGDAAKKALAEADVLHSTVQSIWVDANRDYDSNRSGQFVGIQT